VAYRATNQDHISQLAQREADPAGLEEAAKVLAVVGDQAAEGLGDAF
jgi:hypothetical protein